MQATDKQINYLCQLAERVERLKASHKIDIHFINWQTERYKGVTTVDASIRIKAYRDIIFNANLQSSLLG